MNKSSLNKKLAINYSVLKKLVQNDTLVNTRITKDNINELLDVQKFYSTYFESTKFVQYFPQVCQLVKRETEAAFARLKQRVFIVHKFDEEYPKAILQDFKEEAPLFLYLCGDNTLLDRKVKRVSIVTTINREDAFIEQCKALCETFVGQPYTLLIQNRSVVDHVIYEQLKEREVSILHFVNGPLFKDEDAIKICKSNNPKFGHLSFVGPTDNGMEEYQRIKLMNSLGKVTVLLSDNPNDVHHFSIQNNYSWHKPSVLPLLKTGVTQSFDRVFTLDSMEEFIPLLNNLIS